MDYNQRDVRNLSTNRTNVSTLSTFMSRVYGWMMIGMLVTGAVSFYVGSRPDLVQSIMTNQIFFWALIIVQLLAVVYLSAAIDRISVATAAITYLMYSALTGLTLSVIFVIYTHENIVMAFGTTAIAFGSLSLFGYVTKRDLGPIGSFCMMGLFGIIGAMLLSFFMPSLMGEQSQLIISIIGVIVFAGLTAYDTQKIKEMGMNSGSRMEQRAIIGALKLYLDFLNLFLFILRLMGGRK